MVRASRPLVPLVPLSPCPLVPSSLATALVPASALSARRRDVPNFRELDARRPSRGTVDHSEQETYLDSRNALSTALSVRRPGMIDAGRNAVADDVLYTNALVVASRVYAPSSHFSLVPAIK